MDAAPFRNEFLFSTHYLTHLLPSRPQWHQDVQAAYQRLRALWDDVQALDPARLNEAQLEQFWIRPLLADVLQWHLLAQAQTHIQGRKRLPDYGLYLSRDAVQQAVKHQKEDPGRTLQYATAVAEAKAWDADLDVGSRQNATPHFQMIHYLTWLPPAYGILTNGRHWRLYVKGANVGARTFYEIDIMEALADPEAFKYFYLFFRREAFEARAGREPFIETVRQESRRYAVELEQDLRRIIYGRWLEQAGQAIYKAVPDADPEAVYQATLLLLFRLLFIGYAEARQILPARESSPYYRHSLVHLIRDINDPTYVALPASTALFERIRTLFHIVDKGEPAIEVPPYNGGLFAPRQGSDDAFHSGRQLLEQIRLTDPHTRDLLLMIFTRDGELVDFSTLDTRRLGSIYEGSTEYTFRIAEEPMVWVAAPDGNEFIIPEALREPTMNVIRRYPPRSLYLIRHDGSRKATGTYYTPDAFVEYLVRKTVDETLAPRIQQLEALNRSGEGIAHAQEEFDASAQDLLLDVRIIDPAMGSGHFLVEAVHYLTARYMDLAAQYEFTGIYSAIEELKQAIAPHAMGSRLDDAALLRRIVAKRCIYGIDLNPFAVELTKLALWLETTVPGAPLSYLSHHLRHGNALVGYDLDRGMDELRRAVHSNLFMNQLEDRLKTLSRRMSRIRDLRDSTVDEVYASQKEFLAFLHDVDPLRFLLDLYTAADYPGYEELKPLLHDADLIQSILFEGLEQVPHTVTQRIHQFRRQVHPFHWKLAFPEAWRQGGFDVVIGNPPWDKVKPEDPMFFSRFDPNYRKYNKNRKEALRQRILQHLPQKQAYEQYSRQITAFAAYIKRAYQHYGNVGDPNLYRLFMERAFQMLRDGGLFGFVVPGAFYQEDGSASLRRFLIEKNELLEVLGFENRGVFFPEIHSQFKIVLVIARKGGTTRQPIKTFFLSRRAEDLDDPTARMDYDLTLLKNLSPQKWAFLELHNPKDIHIVSHCYQQYPPLGAPDHPWKIEFTNDLHMTAARHLFHEDGGDLPLYEGKMIWQFRHDWAPPRYWLRLDELKAITRRDGSPKFQLPDGSWRWEHYRVGFRDIASSTNIRTLITALLPFSLSGNTINIEKFPYVNISQKLFSTGYFNSFLADYTIRFLAQTHVNPTQIRRLPFPSLSEDDPRLRRIAELSARLVGYTEAFADLMASLGMDWQTDGIPPRCPDHQQGPLSAAHLLPDTCSECRRLQLQRIRLRAEIDIIVARDIFHLSPNEMEHILHAVRAGKDKPSPLRNYMETLKAEIRRQWMESSALK